MSCVEGDTVLVYLPTLHGGGAERVLLAVSGALVRQGVRVTLVCGTGTGPLVDEIPEGVDYVSLDCRRALATFMPLVRLLRASQHAVALLSTQRHANSLVFLAARVAGWRGRLVLRETNAFCAERHRAVSRQQRIVDALVLHVYRRADAVVAPSAGVAADLGDAKNVVCIPNPIDPDAMRSMANEAVDLAAFGRGPVVFSMGRLTRQKRFDDLLRAFATLDAPAQLVILGNGELRTSLLELADQLGIADRCWFPGFDANPYKYLARAKVFALSSGWEGMPNALLQARALGVSAVSTDCPHGPAEIIAALGGQLVPVGDWQQMGARMRQLLSSAQDAPDAVALQRFSIDNVAAAYKSLLLNSAQVTVESV